MAEPKSATNENEISRDRLAELLNEAGPKTPLGCAHRDDRRYFIAAS
jgi:hypothetical protein